MIGGRLLLGHRPSQWDGSTTVARSVSNRRHQQRLEDAAPVYAMCRVLALHRPFIFVAAAKRWTSVRC